MAAEAELPMVRDVQSCELRCVGGVGMRREAGRHHEKIVRADAAVCCLPRVVASAQAQVTGHVLLGSHRLARITILNPTTCNICQDGANMDMRNPGKQQVV